MTIKPVKPDKNDSDGSSSHRSLNKVSSPKSPTQHVLEPRNSLRSANYAVEEAGGSRLRRGNPKHRNNASNAQKTHKQRMQAKNSNSNTGTNGLLSNVVNLSINDNEPPSTGTNSDPSNVTISTPSNVVSVASNALINSENNSSSSNIASLNSNVNSEDADNTTNTNTNNNNNVNDTNQNITGANSSLTTDENSDDISKVSIESDNINSDDNNVSCNLNPSPATPINRINEEDQNLYSGYNSGDEHIGQKEDLTPEEWEERDKLFEKQMSDRGFILEEIAEDGACLFRSISLQIFGDQEMHEVIRRQTMDYIYKNREYFAQFVTEDITSYVSRKRNNHVHGNHIEIQAMSEIYNRPVELYSYQTEPINIFSCDQMKNGMEPLRLSYQRGSHYNAILNPYKPTVGVGLGLAGYCLTGESPNATHLRDAVRLSEDLAIEQTMFEDKLKTTDWEATNEAIEEQIARESYLQWCREQQAKKQQQTYNTQSNSTITSASIATSVNDHQKLSPKREIEKSDTAFDPVDFFKRNNRTLSTQQTRSKSDDDVFDDVDYDQRSDSSSSSSYYYNTHLQQYQQRKRRSTRCRARAVLSNLPTVNNSGNSNNNSSDGDCSPDLSPTKKRKFSSVDTPGPSTNHSAKESCSSDFNESCSKTVDDKPVSEFYKSLLESSYSDSATALAQLTEEEMLQKALQMSRMDFMQQQPGSSSSQ